MVIACTVLLLVPQEASACVVGIGYRPSVNISDFGHRKTCSTGTSLAGTGTIAVLALGALALLGWGVYRRGEKASGGPAPSGTGPSPGLTKYLDATGQADQAPGNQQAP